MSIWIEIHCDTTGNPPADCAGLEHNYHMGHAATAEKAPAVIKMLTDRALRFGWTRVKGHTYCPACSKARAK